MTKAVDILSTSLDAADLRRIVGLGHVGDSGKLKAGARILLWGDSLFYGNNAVAATTTNITNLSTSSAGEIAWALFRDPRCRFDVFAGANNPRFIAGAAYYIDGANKGIIGSQSSRCLSADERADIAAFNPDILFIGFATNDLAAGVSALAIIANITAGIQWGRSKGYKIVVAGLTPHALSGATDPYNYPEGDSRWATHDALMAWFTQIETQFPGGDVRYYDRFTAVADPTSYKGAIWAAGMHRGDGVHWSTPGAYLASKSLAPILADLVEPGPWFDTNPFRGTFNLLANPRLSTTVGGTAGAGVVSGTVPDGYMISRSGGSDATIAITGEADPDFGGEKLVLTVDPHGATTRQTIKVRTPASGSIGFPGGLSGRCVQSQVPIEVSGGVDLAGVELGVIDNASLAGAYAMAPYSKDGQMVAESYSGWLQTPVARPSNASTGLYHEINMYLKGSSPAVLKIRPALITRLVDDPAIY